jgi:hypothetical protein
LAQCAWKILLRSRGTSKRIFGFSAMFNYEVIQFYI